MQLSAPTLPIDPTAASAPDVTGFQTSGARSDAGSNAPGDFGAILAAKSRNKSGATSSPRTNRQGSTDNSPASSSKKQAEDDLATERRPGCSSLDQGEAAESSIVVDESLAAAAGVVVATPTVPVAETVDAELEVTLPNGFSRAEASNSDSTTESDVGSSSDSLVRDRPMPGGMLTGKSQAPNHAFGLTSPGTAAQSSGNAQAISVARVPAALVGATRTPASSTASTQLAAAGQISPMSDAADGESAEPAISAEPSVLSSPQSGNLASFANPSSISTAGSDTGGKRIDSMLGEAVSLPPPLAELSEESDPTASTLDHPLELETTIGGESPGVAADASDPVAELQRAAANSAVAEKIAAHRSRLAERVSPLEKVTQRILGASDFKEVTTSYGRIGINAAKSVAHMPATALSQSPASLAMENPSFQVNPLSLDSLIAEGAGEATPGQVAFAARRAVESVLSIADQTASTDQRTVRLQFTVGGEELAVRVELRGDRVHTTFRTDSPDLRIALAHEWQSVSAVQSGVRSQRLADPVFASASSSGNGMSSDSGAAYQRDSSARQSHASAEQIFGSRRAVSNTPAVPAVATVSTAVVASSNPLRLHTFA